MVLQVKRNRQALSKSLTTKSTRIKALAASLVPVFLMAGVTLTGSTAHAATQCVSSYTHRDGNVVDRWFFDSLCGGFNVTRNNAYNIRDVNPNRDEVCANRIPLPSDYVVTRYSHDSRCGGAQSLGDTSPDNEVVLEIPYDGMSMCRRFDFPGVPQGFRVTRTSWNSICGGRIFTQSDNTLKLEEINPTPPSPVVPSRPPTSAPSRPPTSAPPVATPAPSQPTSSLLNGFRLNNDGGWYQILRSSNYKEVYQGPGGIFVPLSPDHYEIINLTTGFRFRTLVFDFSN